MINDYEIEMANKRVPSFLETIEYSTIHKIFKVFVVNVDYDYVLRCFKQMSQCLKCIDNNQQFFIMKFIIYFGH